MNLKFTLAVLTSVFLMSLIIGCCKLESDDALPTLNSSSSPYSIPFRQTEQMKQLSLENVFQVSERLFSGGEPKTEQAFDELKLCRQADWQAPSDHPDLVPRSLATIVREGFAECKRLAREDWPVEFIQWLDNSDNQASQLEKGLRDNDRSMIESAFESLSNGCLECHQKYRN